MADGTVGSDSNDVETLESDMMDTSNSKQTIISSSIIIPEVSAVVDESNIDIPSKKKVAIGSDIQNSSYNIRPETINNSSIVSNEKSNSLSLTPSKSDKQNAHTLIATNLALENIFLVTFRSEAAQGQIKYIGGSNNGAEYLNHTNVSEIVCSLLSEGVVIGGAVGYLVGCYRYNTS